MREILFRGKRLQGGNWVEGYFFKSDINKRERESEKSTLIFTPDCDTFIMVPECHNSFMVVSDTVGQYTGLKDKNGKRIFEGDIVRIQSKNYKVKYLLGQFFVGMNMPIAYKRFECDVVGNVYDNQEMLKGGDGE